MLELMLVREGEMLVRGEPGALAQRQLLLLLLLLLLAARELEVRVSVERGVALGVAVVVQIGHRGVDGALQRVGEGVWREISAVGVAAKATTTDPYYAAANACTNATNAANTANTANATAVEPGVGAQVVVIELERRGRCGQVRVAAHGGAAVARRLGRARRTA